MGLGKFTNRTGSLISNGIKGFDLYPQSIQLTFKGKDTFKTLFGGIMSMLILSLCATYGISLLLIMINRGDSNKAVNTEFRDLFTNDQNVFPHEKGFRLGVALTNSRSQSIAIDPSFFTLKIDQGTFIYTGTSVSVQYTDLEYEL